MSDLFFTASNPHPCERLARLEGQSNFLSLMAGIEAGPDTTMDVAALGMIRDRCVPEILEAYWGQSRAYRYALGQLVFNSINAHGKIREKDRIWVKGAILDAYYRFTTGTCKVARMRAKRFRVDTNAYETTRKLAEGLFTAMEGDARPHWLYVRRKS